MHSRQEFADTWDDLRVPYGSMLVMRARCERPMPYFRSKRVAPSVERFAAIFFATVSGEPT